MDRTPKIAQIAALVGDPARANMLTHLMDGRALTASELAHISGVRPQTASGHLAKLCDAMLLTVEKQGRHRYYRLASTGVGHMLEALMVVAEAMPAARLAQWRGGEALRTARSCYDHMAGRMAVRLTDRLVAQAHIVLDQDGGQVTESGAAFFGSIGVAFPVGSTRRAFCRPCLDWSERRPHLAGVVGQALLCHAIDHRWVQRMPDSRALSVTSAGERAFAETFGIVANG